MLFSFIVPVYNTSKYLSECIESLLCQKGADFEIVLIDDGSTDGSGEICDGYAQKNPDTVRVIHKENEGLLLTRRRGFKEAEGDWFICVDSDDAASEDLLESVADAVSRFSPDMVMYNFEYVSGDGQKTKSRLSIPNESVFQGDNKLYIYEQMLLTNNINSVCLKAIKRGILDIDRDYSRCGIRNTCEDEIQTLPLFTNAQKIVFLDTPLYLYRKRQDSITSVSTYEKWKASLICFLKTEEYLDKWKVPDELKKRFYTHSVETLSNFLQWVFFSREPELEKPRAEIVRSVSVHPAFKRCAEMYDKSCASTKYLKFRIPKIINLVKKQKVRTLWWYYHIEKII